MFFDKKYGIKKEEYFKEIFNFAKKLGYNNLNFAPKDGRLYLVNLDKGKKIYLLEIIIPSKSDCLREKKFKYYIELAREKLLEVYNETNS